jgi:hypothetical protein
LLLRSVVGQLIRLHRYRQNPPGIFRLRAVNLVVRFTNNVSVSLVFDVRQPTLLRNAAMHAVANSVSLVE